MKKIHQPSAISHQGVPGLGAPKKGPGFLIPSSLRRFVASSLFFAHAF